MVIIIVVFVKFVVLALGELVVSMHVISLSKQPIKEVINQSRLALATLWYFFLVDNTSCFLFCVGGCSPCCLLGSST